VISRVGHDCAIQARHHQVALQAELNRAGYSPRSNHPTTLVRILTANAPIGADVGLGGEISDPPM
jgi:hypothetical protein